ncbi:MAG: hypothetical protein K0S32_3477 [Bacteroidetes bacterium]|jgi:hypothetical protein|nr:hypothetical protein [Bacteroidota bacterium]
MTRLLFVLSFCILNTFLQSQVDRTGAIIFFSEKNVIIRLDSSRIEPSKVLKPLKEGTYRIKAWAPTYRLLVDSFTVIKGKTKFYTPHLKHTDEYKLYKFKKTVRNIAVIIPPILTALSLRVYSQKYMAIDKNINQAKTDALYSKELYESSFSPGQFEYYKNEYNDRVSVYNDLINQQNNVVRNGKIVTASFAAISVSAVLWKCLSKKLVYKDSPLLSSIAPSYNFLDNQLCVVIKL